VAKAQIESLEKALDQFRLDMRRYPSAEEGLEALVARPANSANWGGPYLKEGRAGRSMGRPYIYRVPGQRGDSSCSPTGATASPAAREKTRTSAWARRAR